jgi:signal transduction histidine kinase
MTANDRRPEESPESGTGQFGRLKWLTTLLPAGAVFLWETVRHVYLEHELPDAYGNLIAGLVALVFAYAFSEIVFAIVERLQSQAVERGRELAALRATLDERERLSRDLHDSLAQLVASLLLRLDTVSNQILGGRQAQALHEIEQLRGLADDLYTDVRESIAGLRAEVVERGLGPALHDYVDQFDEEHGIRASCESDDLPAHLSPLAELQLFRIVQEALTNVRKHADARQVEVRFARSRPGWLTLSVTDDGRGFDPAAAHGTARRSFGLTTMRERAEDLGGTLTIAPGTAGGTIVTVELPTPTRLEQDTALATAAG